LPKLTKSELTEYQRQLKSRTHEELRIVLPKEAVSEIRKVAKATRPPIATLFEEMAAAITAGTLPEPKSK
jgi:hypothetical protein